MTMTNEPKKKWTLTVSEDEFLDLPDDLLDELQWEVGDELLWEAQEDGSFTLTKITPTA